MKDRKCDYNYNQSNEIRRERSKFKDGLAKSHEDLVVRIPYTKLKDIACVFMENLNRVIYLGIDYINKVKRTDLDFKNQLRLEGKCNMDMQQHLNSQLDYINGYFRLNDPKNVETFLNDCNSIYKNKYHNMGISMWEEFMFKINRYFKKEKEFEEGWI